MLFHTQEVNFIFHVSTLVYMHLDLNNWLLKICTWKSIVPFPEKIQTFSRLQSWEALFLHTKTQFYFSCFYHCKYSFGCQKLTSQKWYLEVHSSFSWEDTDFFKISILKRAFLHTKTQFYFHVCTIVNTHLVVKNWLLKNDT